MPRQKVLDTALIFAVESDFAQRASKGRLATVRYLVNDLHANCHCLNEKPLINATRAGALDVVVFLVIECQVNVSVNND